MERISGVVIDIQDPAVRPREYTGLHLIIGSAIATEELVEEWIASVCRRLVYAPVPIGEANTGVAAYCAEIVLKLTEKLSMP